MTPIFYKLRQNTACHGRGRGFEPRRPRHTFQMTYGMIWRREISEIGCNLGAFCTQFAPKICLTPHPYIYLRRSLRRED